MEFRHLLRRRLVRNYTAESAEREALERIIGTIWRVPSAGYHERYREPDPLQDRPRSSGRSRSGISTPERAR